MNAKQEFFSAVAKGEAAKVKRLLLEDPALAGAADQDGVSAVLKATYYRQKEVVDLLLATGVELNIFEAAATGRTERVRALLKKDSGLANAFSPDGFMPVGLATFFGHPEAAEALLAGGAEVNVSSRNAMKVAPLHAAAAARQVEIARLLLERGADANARQEGDFVALHEVASNGQVEFARLLLAHGADVNARSKDGKTALTFALEHKHTEVAQFLRERGGVQ